MELLCTNGVSWGAIYEASDTTAFTVKFCSSSGNVVDYPLAVVVNGGTYTYDDTTKEYEITPVSAGTVSIIAQRARVLV